MERQKIIDCLTGRYGIEVAALTPLELGADVDASTYKAVDHDGNAYFVKVKAQQNDGMGATIVTALCEGEVQQVIPPIKTVCGQPMQPLGDDLLIVYPFIEGENGFSRDLTEDQWVTLGEALRQVHDFKGVAAVKDLIRRETYSTKWRDSVRSLLSDIDGGLLIDEEIGLKLLAFIKDHRLEIDQLVERAGLLGQKIKGQSPECVLCHSDIHAGNVLIGSNGHIYLVDWDEPIFAPKERDLMFIGGAVANVWNNPQENDFFYRGYGEVEVNREILAYYRHERIVEDIAIYGQQLLRTTAGGEARKEMYHHFTAMFAKRGVVEIAFATD